MVFYNFCYYFWGQHFFLQFWWQQLAAGRSLNCASCWGSWGERSCPGSATAIHSVVVDRTPKLSRGGHFITELLQLFAEVNIVAEHVNAKRMTITAMGVLLHWTQANSFELVKAMGARRHVKTGAIPGGAIETIAPPKTYELSLFTMIV